MDELQIANLIKNCKILKYKFRGIFAANNFPLTGTSKDCFMIVNASSSNSHGTHWLLICHFKRQVYFADPLGLSLASYTTIYRRLSTKYKTVYEVTRDRAIQSATSNLCGLFCIYIAHSIFNRRIEFLYLINDYQLKVFAQHML